MRDQRKKGIRSAISSLACLGKGLQIDQSTPLPMAAFCAASRARRVAVCEIHQVADGYGLYCRMHGQQRSCVVVLEGAADHWSSLDDLIECLQEVAVDMARIQLHLKKSFFKPVGLAA